MRRSPAKFLVGVSSLLILACGPPSDVSSVGAGSELARELEGNISARYFPPVQGAWEEVAPEEVGWSSEALEGAVEYARDQRSSGLLIAVNNRIVVERTWEVSESDRPAYGNLLVGSTPEGRAIEDVASVQKGIVSFLLGVASGKGLVDFDAPVSKYLGEGWSKVGPEAEDAIVVRHLMSMSSGLTPALEYQSPAGEKWRYNTNAYSRLCRVLEVVSGMEIGPLTAEWLTDAIGMSESAWGPRTWIAEGADANRIGFQTTARDLARFGVLILEGGVWEGEDLLANGGYLDRSLSSSQEMNPAYGLLWWLNRRPSGRTLVGEAIAEPTFLIPAAPRDLVAAQGALGRKVYVVPSLDLVVTRIGDQPEAAFNQELWRRLMAAAPSVE